MINLDDPKVHIDLDPSNMRKCIRELPEHCLKAWHNGLAFKLPADYGRVNKVVISGMGGSAIGADLVASLESKVPVIVCREYEIPPFVDGNTLFIASSYSGCTEETLSAFHDAIKTPSMKLVMTTGGTLKEMAVQVGIPVYTIDYKAPPRTALAHSFMPLLAILCRLGLISDKSQDVEEMGRVIGDLQSEIHEKVPLVSNPAKQLAVELRGKLGVIYGAGFLTQVARRWKTQINENSKAFAFCETLPEMNHNAVVGYEFPEEIKDRLLVIMLRSQSLHERTLLRCRITADLLSNARVAHRTVEGKGASALSQMMSLVLFGDWVSYYLALLNETDPLPVKVIDQLKKRLAES